MFQKWYPIKICKKFKENFHYIVEHTKKNALQLKNSFLNKIIKKML